MFFHCAGSAILALAGFKCEVDSDCGPGGKCVSGNSTAPGAACAAKAAALKDNACVCIAAGLKMSLEACLFFFVGCKTNRACNMGADHCGSGSESCSGKCT